MPFLDRVALALGLQEPKAQNRFTREPIIFSDDLPFERRGQYDPLAGVIEVRPDIDKDSSLRHETAHSLFNKANTSSLPVKLLKGLFGSNVSPIINNLQKQAPLERLRNIKPQDFEHLVISALEGEPPELVEDGIKRGIGVGNISKSDILDAINNLPLSNEQEKEAIQKLNQVFRNRRK